MTRKTINLILGIHCHQPVDNFDHVIREAFERGYLPFIDVLNAHPEIKAVLHYSGPLYEWSSKHNRGFFKRLRSLRDSGQIEIMGGGFYEPIFSLIPDADKINQIKMLGDFIRKEFSCRVRGAWLSERIWEPSFPRVLAEAGIEYTVVDEGHFKRAGIGAEDNLGYYATEEEGNRIFLFGNSHKLRYLVPFANPERVIDYLANLASREEGRVVVIADDGERFGVWPGTERIVYRERWLERFFALLRKNRHWINLLTFSEFIDRYPPKGRIYLPSSAYPEMTEWAGGYFRNFLIKYPESNNMHKRMLEVSERLRTVSRRRAEQGKMETQKPERKSSGSEKELLRRARQELYRGQCNCAYWHGVFGGLYLSHLRSSIYRHLITAEKLIDEIEGVNGGVVCRAVDFDRDGKDEVTIDSATFRAYLAPSTGGTLFEFDYKPMSVNLVNTLSRTREEYHRQFMPRLFTVREKSSLVNSIYQFLGTKEKHLGRYLKYDGYRRSCLIDHFLRINTTVSGFSRGNYQELGDFVNQPYQYRWQEYPADENQTGYDGQKLSGRRVKLILVREGNVGSGKTGHPVRVTKTLTAGDREPEMLIDYQLENVGSRILRLNFAIECNLSVKNSSFAGVGSLRGRKSFHLEDEWHHLVIDYWFDRETEIWYFPVEAVSESEGGLERTYQQLCLLFNWQFALEAGENWQVRIRKRVGK